MKFLFNIDIDKCRKITDVIILVGCICGLINGLVSHNWGQVEGFTFAILLGYFK